MDVDWTLVQHVIVALAIWELIQLGMSIINAFVAGVLKGGRT